MSASFSSPKSEMTQTASQSGKDLTASPAPGHKAGHGEIGHGEIQPQHKTWVQSGLAIATGYLLLALGIIAIMGLLGLQGIKDFNLNLLLILTLAQLCLATAGGYITALLAPSKASLQPTKSLVKHGLGLAALVFVFWLIPAIASNSQEPGHIQILNLTTAFIGVGTGTWLRSRQI